VCSPVFSNQFAPPVGGPRAGATAGRRLYQKGLQTFNWKAEDDNDDRLQFDVYYRAPDTTGWTLLRRNVADDLLVWDTTSVPDGLYSIKVVASDAYSNAPGTALTGERESEVFAIDNHPPAVTIVQVSRDANRTRVVVDVRDTTSPIDRAEVSIDAGNWKAVYPADGAADSRRERYDLWFDGDVTGRLMLRVTDTMNNAATLRVESGAPSPASQPR
jgi:hypothetical protein